MDPQHSQTKSKFSAISSRYQQLIKKDNKSKNLKGARFFKNLQLYNLMIVLQENKIKFKDQIFPYQSLMPPNSCYWKRAKQLFKGENFRSPNWDFQYQKPKNSQRYTNNELKQVAIWLKSQNQHQHLLQKIFVDSGINAQQIGIHRLVFCLNGQDQQEIVIDSYIPTDHQNRYISDRPQKGGGIWMIILEKALAKIYGSYQKLQKLTRYEILSQIIGYPNPFEYRFCPTKRHLEVEFKSKTSYYYRLGFTKVTNFCLSFWFKLNFDLMEKHRRQNEAYDNLMIDMIQYDEESSVRIPINKIKQKTHSNLLKINGQQTQMIGISINSKIYIHIFNRSNHSMTCNMVCQSDSEDLYIKQCNDDVIDKECRKIKRLMIEHEYTKIHDQLDYIATATEKVRCTQMGHRIIICAKNTMPKERIIRLQIKQNYQKQLYFQDNMEAQFIEYKVKPQTHCIFVICKSEDRACGNFYSISNFPTQ